MVSSKFDLSCLAPTDNSLTKTFLLLLHFLVFCAFIITPHFHLCKHFLTFIFSKFKSMFYIHQKKVRITHVYLQFLIIFLSSQFHLHIQLNYYWIQSLGSLTLAHSQNSQMSFMYGFFFVKSLFSTVVCVVIVI